MLPFQIVFVFIFFASVDIHGLSNWLLGQLMGVTNSRRGSRHSHSSRRAAAPPSSQSQTGRIDGLHSYSRQQSHGGTHATTESQTQQAQAQTKTGPHPLRAAAAAAAAANLGPFAASNAMLNDQNSQLGDASCLQKLFTRLGKILSTPCADPTGRLGFISESETIKSSFRIQRAFSLLW